MISQILWKSCQVKLSWPKLGPSWAKLASTWPMLASEMQASIYKFTRFGSQALLERNLFQHSANIAPTWPKILPKWKPQKANPTPLFRSLFVLEVFLAPRGPKKGPKRTQKQMLLESLMLLGRSCCFLLLFFAKAFECFWIHLGFNTCLVLVWYIWMVFI